MTGFSGCDVERVFRIGVVGRVLDVRMVGDPRMRLETLVALCDDSQDLSDFKPARQDVQVRRRSHVLPAAIAPLHLSEPSEEEKDVTGTNPAALQMRLCRAGLSQRGTPSRHALVRESVQVRVEMHSGGKRMLPLAQVLEQ